MHKHRFHKKSIFFSFLILLSCCSGCITPSGLDNEDNSKKDTVVLGVLFNETIYPLGTNNDNFWTIVPNIFNGLVEFDENFRIIAALAVSWNNPDNLTWRFYLRQGVRFHNGEDFSADDVKYSLDTMSSGFDSIIKNITVVDAYTVELRTYAPYPGLLERLAHVGLIYCKNVTEKEGPLLIGTGPYRLVDYEINNYTTLEWFDEYWGEKPPIKTVVFKAIEDNEARLDALLSGAIDIAEYNIDERFDEIQQEQNIAVVKYPPLSTYFIGFDMRENGSYGYPDGNNPTADVRVRKAIYQAINVTSLINGPFKGFAQPESQLFSHFVFGYNPGIERFPYNLSSARQLLTDAGYEQGFNITMDCITEGYPYNAENCYLITQQLSKIGIHIHMNNLSVVDFNRKVVNERNTSMYLVGWGAISVDGGWFYDLIIRSVGEDVGKLNSGYYSNPEVDRLGIAASQQMNPEKRLLLLKEGFRIALVDDVMVVPLLSQELLILTTKNIVFPPRADLRVVVKDIRFY
jgi:peptide/nickel transport system substrate-binding protein